MPHPDECRRMSCTGIEYIGGPPYQGACCTQTKVSSRWVTCVFLKIFLSPVHSQDGSIRAMKLSNACALNLEQLEHLRVCQMFPLQWLKCHPQKRTMYFEIVKVQLLQSGKINGRGEGRGCGVWMGWVVAGGGLKKIYTHSDFFKISASDKVFFNSFELCRFRHTDKYYNAIFFFLNRCTAAVVRVVYQRQGVSGGTGAVMWSSVAIGHNNYTRWDSRWK